LYRRVPTWVTDMRDVAPPEADVPGAARRRSEFTRSVVEAATSRRAGESWPTAVLCIGRRGRKVCGGEVHVGRRDDAVEWSCAACGDSGVIRSFAGTDADFSVYVPRGKTVLWGFDAEERAALLESTTHIPELRAVIARGRPHRDIPGLLLVEATVEELDEMYTLVEELTDATRSRRRIEIYDGLRASLCSSIDGF
jgi:hypothetical protein